MTEITTARTKTVLVFNESGTATAIITELIVRVLPFAADCPRLTFSGQVEFDGAAVAHATEEILPLVDEICGYLSLERKCFDVSAINVGVASRIDRGVHLSDAGSNALCPSLSRGR